MELEGAAKIMSSTHTYDIKVNDNKSYRALFSMSCNAISAIGTTESPWEFQNFVYR